MSSHIKALVAEQEEIAKIKLGAHHENVVKLCFVKLSNQITPRIHNL